MYMSSGRIPRQLFCVVNRDQVTTRLLSFTVTELSSNASDTMAHLQIVDASESTVVKY